MRQQIELDQSTDDDTESSGGSNKSSPSVDRKSKSSTNVNSATTTTKSFTLWKKKQETKKTVFYAVKILSKSSLIKAKQVDHVLNEMTLQEQLDHPFIVSIHSSLMLPVSLCFYR